MGAAGGGGVLRPLVCHADCTQSDWVLRRVRRGGCLSAVRGAERSIGCLRSLPNLKRKRSLAHARSRTRAPTARFAERRLQRGGRCHESEIWAAYRREPGAGARRSKDALPDATLRTMVLNWYPEAERTRWV